MTALGSQVDDPMSKNDDTQQMQDNKESEPNDDTKEQERKKPKPTATPSKGERLITLMDHYADKPGGMWHEMYHARVFFRDYFDDGCSSDEGREFAKNWCRVRTFICAMDGLSDVERDAICVECHAWCPSLSKQELSDICDESIGLTSDELQKVCDRINETYPMESRRALLLNSLCGACLDGLDNEEYEGFIEIAKRLDVDSATAADIYSLYLLELQLKQKYDAFYYSK
eukprot:191779_1